MGLNSSNYHEDYHLSLYGNPVWMRVWSHFYCVFHEYPFIILMKERFFSGIFLFLSVIPSTGVHNFFCPTEIWEADYIFTYAFWTCFNCSISEWTLNLAQSETAVLFPKLFWKFGWKMTNKLCSEQDFSNSNKII